MSQARQWRFGSLAKILWVSWAYLFLLAPMAVVIGSSLDGTKAYTGERVSSCWWLPW